jgi:hypothetical protein
LTGPCAFDQPKLYAIFGFDADYDRWTLRYSDSHCGEHFRRLHRFFWTGYPAEISDNVLPLGSSCALTYEQEMLDSRIGFLIERANDISDYYFDRIQSESVG